MIRGTFSSSMVLTAWVLTATLTACSTPPSIPDDLENVMSELEQKTLRDMGERYPASAEEFDQAVGYAIFSVRATKVPLVGQGQGIGVAVDAKDERRAYLRITHTDVGGGLGNVDYRLIVIFSDRSDFERSRDGALDFSAGVYASASDGTREIEGTSQSTSRKAGRAIYLLTDSGAGASWSVHLIRFTVIEEP